MGGTSDSGNADGEKRSAPSLDVSADSNSLEGNEHTSSKVASLAADEGNAVTNLSTVELGDERKEEENTNVVTSTSTPTEGTETPPRPSWKTRLVNFYWQNQFLILSVLSIVLAWAYPPLGVTYLAPNITANWIAVCLIFLLAGLGLKTQEFFKAFQQLGFNTYVQVYNFGFVSAITYLVSRALHAITTNLVSQGLADGMVICACLPMTINTVIVLTKSAGGDEPLAVINSAFGNIVGVFLSPIMILGYLGVTGNINLGDVFVKLVVRVVVPLVVGQILQKMVPPLFAFYQKHKSMFKVFQELCLVFIVYTVFCTTFAGNSWGNTSIGAIFWMIFVVLLLLILFMVLSWVSIGFLFKDKPEMRVMGLYGCTHKTVALGVPLIKTIYENSSIIGVYTLPLLIWHTTQLVLGTFLAPHLNNYVQREQKRLGTNPPPDDLGEQTVDIKDEES